MKAALSSNHSNTATYIWKIKEQEYFWCACKGSFLTHENSFYIIFIHFKFRKLWDVDFVSVRFILCINMFVGEGFTLFTHSYHKLHWWVEVYYFMFWKTRVFFSWTVYVHLYPVSIYEILSSQSSVCPGFLKSTSKWSGKE